VNIFHFTSPPVSLSSVIVVFSSTLYVITVAPAEQLEQPVQGEGVEREPAKFGTDWVTAVRRAVAPVHP
jgi:hypothetical protein